MCLDFLCGVAISLVQDECEAHAPFLVDVQGFGMLDFQQPPRLEALKAHYSQTPFSDQPKPTPSMLGMNFLKEHRCVVNYGEDLVQLPLQSECWWPLFVSSRGLYYMPLCGQPWVPSSQTQ